MTGGRVGNVLRERVREVPEGRNNPRGRTSSRRKRKSEEWSMRLPATDIARARLADRLSRRSLQKKEKSKSEAQEKE